MTDGAKKKPGEIRTPSAPNGGSVERLIKSEDEEVIIKSIRLTDPLISNRNLS
jgi:hypothetical protein